MTDAYYARAKATADRVIGKRGRAAILRQPGTPTGPAHNQTPGTPIDHPVVFVTDSYSNTEVDGTRIQRKDKRLIMAVGSLEIEPTTACTIVEKSGGLLYKIIAVDPVEPGETTPLYEIQARR